jgi:hypothetical protein
MTKHCARSKMPSPRRSSRRMSVSLDGLGWLDQLLSLVSGTLAAGDCFVEATEV